MLAELLHRFYCMPLWDIACIVLAVSFGFLWLRDVYGDRRWWKVLEVLGLTVSVVLIYIQTIRGRVSGGVPQEPLLTPFHTYRAYLAEPFEEILRMNFMNTVLVYPAGLFFCELLPKKWRIWRVLPVVLILGAICAGIEYCQYAFALGQAEIDDVLHNTLGALLGALAALCPFPEKTVKKILGKVKGLLLEDPVVH